MQQMDQITQQNAANAEETVSASEEMSAQAQNLMEQINILSSQVGSDGSESTQILQKESSEQAAREGTARRTSQALPVGKTKVGARVGSRQSKKNPEEVIPMGKNGIGD